MRQSMIAVCVAATLTGCGHREAAPSAAPPLSVSTDTVKRGVISTYVTFDGEITPIYQTTLSTAESGTIASVNVSEGDFVKAGRILATLDTSQLQATLAASEAQVRQGEAQVEHSVVAAPIASQQYSSAVANARQGLAAAMNNVRTARAALAHDDLTKEADSQLLAQSYVSRQTYEQALASYVASRETLRSNEQLVTAQRAALGTALVDTGARREDQATIAQGRAQVDGARANVALLHAQIAQSSIVAPFDGQITQRLLDPGASAGPNAPILEIAQVSRVYIVANVPDVDLGAVPRGKLLSFTTPSLPGRFFTGRVFDVNTTPTAGTLSYRVRLLQSNPGVTLRGGMLVNVKALRARHTGALLVPSVAVVGGNDGSAVFTILDGKARNVSVRVGLETDAMSEVYGVGITPGRRVITSPPSGLQDGSPVIQPHGNATARRVAESR